MDVEPRESLSEASPQAMLELVRALVAELSPRLDPRQVSLDSHLTDDLGLDSLSRLELLRRLDHAFGAALPEEALFAAETPRDLLAALQRAPRLRLTFAPEVALPPADASGFPRQARTLVEVLDWHLQAHPERPHLYMLEDEGPKVLSHAELWHRAARAAGTLRAHGLLPGQRVGLMLPTSLAYFEAFFGILLAGGVPVPLYPPFRREGLEDHLRRQAGILAKAEASLLLTTREAQRFAHLLEGEVPSVRAVLTPDALASGAPSEPTARAATDLALLQFTSGSTGQPKGVMLTHANLLANVRAMGQALNAGPEDVFVSWLPLYHDMGLIGAWFGSLYHGAPLVVMPPTAFLARPERWLWAIHQYRGTLSAAPNFAYELAARKIDDAALAGLDLSSWRLALNGAEPVRPSTLERFAARYAPHGFRREALAPVYGLAESSVGLAFPPPGRGPLVEAVQREALAQAGRALPAAAGDPHAVRLVACGQPLPGHQIRIVDAAGREVPERVVGRLQFQGPSCTQGYFHDPERTRALFDGPWLESGDTAYIAGTDVYLTGRLKDLVIIAGRNLSPDELEEAIGDRPGVRKGCVAVFGSQNAETGTEKLVVVAETREADRARRAALRADLVATALALWDLAPDDVVLVPPHAVPKTSSGKLRRADCRALYERGALQRRPSTGRELARLALRGVPGALTRGKRQLGEHAYAAYVWGCFGLLAPGAWTLVVLLPRLAWRRRTVAAVARGFLRLVGIPLRIEGELPLDAETPGVLVCNHTSFTDVLMLTAALPPTVRYVALRSFQRHFLTRVFMERLGTLFVDPEDPRRGREDTAPLLAALRRGERLLIFPEAGISRAPGLRPFRLGAFLAATEAHVPIVPVSLWGTRSLLRGESWFPRPGAVRLTIGEAIAPDGEGWEAIVHLRDQAYAAILRHCGEPAVSQGLPTWTPPPASAETDA